MEPPVLVIYVQFTQHTFQFLLTNKCITGKKKIKGILLSETTRHKHLTYIYRLINKYDTFLKYASFVVLLKKHRWIAG